MKKLLQILLIGVIAITVNPTMIRAQKIDTNRMNRDIRIMENILGELFKVQITNGGRNSMFISNMGGINSRGIRGTYLPGYGVIMMVPQNSYFGRGIQVISRDGNSASISFYYDSDEQEGDRSVDKESVIARIKEFLKDYGSTIGQLDDNEHINVIYGSKSSRELAFALYPGSNTDESDTPEKLPVISISAKVKDLKDYRTGKINDGKLEDRLVVSTVEDKEYLDLKVMSNIFETALRDKEKDAFRLSGTINYMMLDNFGALFSMDVMYSEFGSFGREFDELRRLRDRMHDERTKRTGVNEEPAPGAPDVIKDSEREAKAEEAYKRLKNDLKEYLVDYGRTLSSLNDDHYVLLSVNIGGRWDTIPDRFDVQIKKSVLSRLDNGKISREEALESVVLKEY